MLSESLPPVAVGDTDGDDNEATEAEEEVSEESDGRGVVVPDKERDAVRVVDAVTEGL